MKTAVKVLAVLIIAAAAAVASPEGVPAGERFYTEDFSVGLPCGWDVLLDDGGREVTLVLPGEDTAIITVKAYKNESDRGLDEIWETRRDLTLSTCDCEAVRESTVNINGVRWKRLEYVYRYRDEDTYCINMFTLGGGMCFRLDYTGVSYKTFMDNMPDFDEVASDIRLFDTYKGKGR